MCAGNPFKKGRQENPPTAFHFVGGSSSGNSGNNSGKKFTM